MPLRILVVEDDKHIRRILESLLAHEPQLKARGPAKIVLADDGKAGLEALEQGRPDLVISDLLMPQMDGFQFCRELRKHKNGKGVPLIVTSAIYKDAQMIAKLQSETGAEFFSKPFQVRELMAAVRRLLGEKKSTEVQAPRGASSPSVAEAAQQGSIAQRRPPRLLLDLAEQRATGTLTLQRGKVRKDIVILHGTPVAATSSLRTETLGHFLVAQGILDEARHRQALEQAQQGQDRLGNVLIALGFIGEQALLKQLGAQMRHKLVSVLRWTDGSHTFQQGQPAADTLHTPVDPARLVFSGLQKSAHIDEFARELAQLRGRIGLTLRAERHREAFARVFGPQGLDALQRRPLIEDVLAGGDLTGMLVQVDALLLCGMAEVEPSSSPKGAPRPESDPAALAKIVASGPSATATAPPPTLYDELFGDEPSEVRPPPAAAQPPSLADADHDEESGVMAIPAAQPAQATSPASDPEAEALRKEVLTEYLGIHGKDYYRVLGLARDAATADIAEAYAAIRERFRLERFQHSGLGRDYAHLEELHQIFHQAFETLSSRSEREKYDRVLAARARPSHAALDADLLGQEAHALLQNGNARGAREKLERAVAHAPDQADYHAQLGWATFHEAGGSAKGSEALAVRKAAAQARPHLDHALAINPDCVDAHDFAGRVAAATGENERAVRHLERVLDADLTRGDALMALESAQTRRGDFKGLERQYRKLIHRLGDKHDPERALRLWWRLAELYRTRLQDKDSARVAYEIAAKLAPDDPRPREALALLLGEDPGAWEQAAQALRESWRLEPTQAQPGLQLLKLHSDGARWDAALQAAGVLVARGSADAAATEFWRRHRPRFLQRAAQPISAELYNRVRHPDESADLARLFARVFAVHHPPFGLADVGVGQGDLVALESLPEPFRQVLEYVAAQLGVAAPPVYRRADFSVDVHVGALDPPVLLAGSQAFTQGDRLLLAFHLGRALSYLWPGRAVSSALPGRQLKATLLAALTLASPSLRVEDPDGQIALLRAPLAAAPDLQKDIAPLVARILANPQGTLNLSRYARGLARTADRIGLLLSGDLPIAARIAADSGVTGAHDDLLDFALSSEYLQAREALGLSIAV